MSVKIGLETHITLDLKNKLFCKCKNEITAQINTNICEVCLGEPGTLPSLNKKAIQLCILSANLLNCKLSDTLSFDRKHYVYPDLPKGYQITQFFNPFAKSGNMRVYDQNLNYIKTINITNIQVEEDPCSLDVKHKLIDYNRSGRALIEIVTEPQFTSANEVIAYIKTLLCKLESAKICNPLLGSVFRCDVNISTAYHDRVEVKNVGSLIDIEKCIDFEIKRQKKEKGTSHTRSWNSILNKTEYSRIKENELEYAYLKEFNISERQLKNDNFQKAQDIHYRYEHLKQIFSQNNNKNITNKHCWSLAQDYEIYLFFETLTFDFKFIRLIELMYKFKQKFTTTELINKTKRFLLQSEFTEKKYIYYLIDIKHTKTKSIEDTITELSNSDEKFNLAIELLKKDFNHKSKGYVIGKLSQEFDYEFEKLNLILKDAINNN